MHETSLYNIDASTPDDTFVLRFTEAFVLRSTGQTRCASRMSQEAASALGVRRSLTLMSVSV